MRELNVKVTEAATKVRSMENTVPKVTSPMQTPSGGQMSGAMMKNHADLEEKLALRDDQMKQLNKRVDDLI